MFVYRLLKKIDTAIGLGLHYLCYGNLRRLLGGQEFFVGQRGVVLGRVARCRLEFFDLHFVYRRYRGDDPDCLDAGGSLQPGALQRARDFFAAHRRQLRYFRGRPFYGSKELHVYGVRGFWFGRRDRLSPGDHCHGRDPSQAVVLEYPGAVARLRDYHAIVRIDVDGLYVLCRNPVVNFVR